MDLALNEDGFGHGKEGEHCKLLYSLQVQV